VHNGNAAQSMNGHGMIAPETIGRLRMLASNIPPEELSEVWVFPPLPDLEDSQEFVLFTRRMSEGVFRVCAAEFTRGESARVTVYGAVPEARVMNVVAGFQRRLGDRREPLHLPIFGSVDRWRLVVGADPEPVLRLETLPSDNTETAIAV